MVHTDLSVMLIFFHICFNITMMLAAPVLYVYPIDLEITNVLTV